MTQWEERIVGAIKILETLIDKTFNPFEEDALRLSCEALELVKSEIWPSETEEA